MRRPASSFDNDTSDRFVGYHLRAMANLFEKLFGVTVTSAPVSEVDTDTVRRIARKLEDLPPERARFLAAFSFVLARVANADRVISEEETRRMVEIVGEFGALPEEQAVLAVEIAKAQERVFGGTEGFLVTRQFNQLASRDEKERLLHCLFAVSAADDSISLAEENEVRRIATEFGFSHADFSRVRSDYNDKRSILKKLP